MHFIENPKAFCEILTMLRTQLGPSDTRILAFHLYSGDTVDEVVETCRKSDEAAAKAYSQDQPCTILDAVKEEYAATERSANELIETVRNRFQFADTMLPTMRAVTYLGQEASLKHLRELMTNLYALGEHIQWLPNETMDDDVYFLEGALNKVKHDLIAAHQNPVSQAKKSKPDSKKKQRRRKVSVATKARKARIYGRAWRERKLNHTYSEEYKIQWEANHKLLLTECTQDPLPTLNPIPPEKARALQTMMDARPQQVSKKATATRRIPLTSF